MSYFARAESLSSLGEMPALRPQPASVGELCPRSLLLPSPTPEPPFRLHCSQPISQQGILPSKARRGNSKGREAVGQEVRAAFIQSDAFVHVRKAPPRFALLAPAGSLILMKSPATVIQWRPGDTHLWPWVGRCFLRGGTELRQLEVLLHPLLAHLSPHCGCSAARWGGLSHQAIGMGFRVL